MKLITIKEYCKIEGISDQGARKRVNQKLVKSIQLDEKLYFIIEDKQPTIIKDLKAKIRLLNSNIKTLKAEKTTIQNQEELIKELKDKIIKLEDKVEININKKEELYEKVIAQMNNIYLTQ